MTFNSKMCQVVKFLSVFGIYILTIVNAKKADARIKEKTPIPLHM